MGPVEVTAGAVLLLVAVVCVGVWVAAARRRRNRRRREEAERGADDAAMRAEVLDAWSVRRPQWDRTAGTAGTVGTAVGTEAADPAASAGAGPVELNGASQDHRAEPAETRPVARPEYAPAAAEPARHGRPGRRIRVRWHPRA